MWPPTGILLPIALLFERRNLAEMTRKMSGPALFGGNTS
jgi:hypothetical protein